MSCVKLYIKLLKPFNNYFINNPPVLYLKNCEFVNHFSSEPHHNAGKGNGNNKSVFLIQKPDELPKLNKNGKMNAFPAFQ